MKDLLEKGLLLGLGAAEYTREALAKTIVELEKKGDVSRKDAKKMMDSIAKSTGKRRKEFEKSIEKTISGLLGKMNIATEAKLKRMDKRLKAVERKLKAKKK